VLFELAAGSKRALGGAVLPVGKPDLDNLLKAVLDAINAIVFADDSQVVSLLASKTYGARPQVSVSVSQIGGAL
jgi:Holliday junction resolvase RusA-like endonuclease